MSSATPGKFPGEGDDTKCLGHPNINKAILNLWAYSMILIT